MSRSLVSLVAFASIFALAPAVQGAPCKDAKGKFIKCPPAKPVPCKDTRGKFVKCGAPGAKAVR